MQQNLTTQIFFLKNPMGLKSFKGHLKRKKKIYYQKYLTAANQYCIQNHCSKINGCGGRIIFPKTSFAYFKYPVFL